MIKATGRHSGLELPKTYRASEATARRLRVRPRPGAGKGMANQRQHPPCRPRDTRESPGLRTDTARPGLPPPTTLPATPSEALASPGTPSLVPTRAGDHGWKSPGTNAKTVVFLVGRSGQIWQHCRTSQGAGRPTIRRLSSLQHLIERKQADFPGVTTLHTLKPSEDASWPPGRLSEPDWLLPAGNPIQSQGWTSRHPPEAPLPGPLAPGALVRGRQRLATRSAGTRWSSAGLRWWRAWRKTLASPWRCGLLSR